MDFLSSRQNSVIVRWEDRFFCVRNSFSELVPLALSEFQTWNLGSFDFGLGSSLKGQGVKPIFSKTKISLLSLLWSDFWSACLCIAHFIRMP